MILENEIKTHINLFFKWINHPQIQNHYLKNLENWDALCASLHIISDLQRPKEEYHSLHSINYLQTIGIIQTIYIEQDSVETLKFAIIEQTKGRQFSLSNYKEIRDLRNKVFGHPSEKKTEKTKTRHFFDIVDSENEIIKHIFWGTEAKIDSKYFAIPDLISTNSKVTIAYLEEIENQLKLKFEKIVANYKIKFEDLFKGASYIFEKLLTKENDTIAINTYNSIEEDIERVKQGLGERNITEEYERKIEVIEFLSKKLKVLFGNQTYKDVEFYTYASTLKNNIQELTKELKGVDKIFEQA